MALGIETLGVKTPVSDAKKTLSRQIWMYFLTSGLAALVNFASRFYYNMFFLFGTSVVLAYCTGMLVNFTLSKLYTFDSRKSGKTHREVLKFFVVAGLGLLVTYVVSTGLLHALNPYFESRQELLKTISHIGGMGVGFVANFVGHKLVTFKTTGLWDSLTRK